MAETITAPPTITPVPGQGTQPADVSPSQPTTTAMPTQTTQVEPAGDILTRVSKKKESPTPQDTAGTFKEFDDITDPIQREKLISREKERVADYTRKTQDLARQREEFDKFKRDSQNWTPERIQNELLKNPQFLQAAQQVTSIQNPAGSGLTDEQFSALTPGEKSQLMEMNRQIGELRQQNLLSALNQKDALLQAKYGDYDALKINQGIQELARMNPVDIREQAYKALLHDEHVKAAYDLGRQEASTLNQTRVQAATNLGSSALPANEIPKREAKENDTAYFARLANRRLEQARAAKR